MSFSISPDQNAVYVAMESFLSGILPENVVVIRGLPNRAAMPPTTPGFVSMQAMFTERLHWGIDTYTEGGVDPPVDYTIQQSLDIAFQIDCYGKDSGSWAAIVTAAFNDTYGCNALGPDCQPLYCNEGRMMPLTNEELEYEERWNLDGHLQWNPVMTVLQEYADELNLTLRDVNVEFPT